MVLLPKKQHLFLSGIRAIPCLGAPLSHREKHFEWLLSRFWIADVNFLMDTFPCCWSSSPFFILHMNISSGLTTLFTFSFVICWNLWWEELEQIRTSKSNVKMCFICSFAVNPGCRIPLSITFWLQLDVLQTRVEVRGTKSWVCWGRMTLVQRWAKLCLCSEQSAPQQLRSNWEELMEIDTNEHSQAPIFSLKNTESWKK